MLSGKEHLPFWQKTWVIFQALQPEIHNHLYSSSPDAGLRTYVHICIYTQVHTNTCIAMKVKLKIFSKCSSTRRLSNLQTTCVCKRASGNKACWCEEPHRASSLLTYTAMQNVIHNKLCLHLNTGLVQLIFVTIIQHEMFYPILSIQDQKKINILWK